MLVGLTSLQARVCLPSPPTCLTLASRFHAQLLSSSFVLFVSFVVHLPAFKVVHFFPLLLRTHLLYLSSVIPAWN